MMIDKSRHALIRDMLKNRSTVGLLNLFQVLVAEEQKQAKTDSQYCMLSDLWILIDEVIKEEVSK